MKIEPLDATPRTTKSDSPKKPESNLEEMITLEIDPLLEGLETEEPELELLDSENLDSRDPLRLYLRQMGRMPLLSVIDEKATARKIELGMHIFAVKFDLETKGLHPTASLIFQQIIRDFVQATEIIQRLREKLDLPRVTNFRQIFTDQKFKKAVDDVIDQSMVQSLADEMTRK